MELSLHKVSYHYAVTGGATHNAYTQLILKSYMSPQLNYEPYGKFGST